MPANTPPRIGLHTGHDTQRRETEAFIGSVYAKAYGAELTGFMPVLMALRGLDGAPEAALGLHPACEGPLFLEHYLDTPIEVALGQALDRAGLHTLPRERTGMVEVGNLAATTSGGARLLITALTALLHANGTDWAVFTATSLLQRSFSRLGIELVDIARADADRLGEERHAWGRYYDTRPRVMAASVAQSRDALLAGFALETAHSRLHRLWDAALHTRCPTLNGGHAAA